MNHSGWSRHKRSRSSKKLFKKNRALSHLAIDIERLEERTLLAATVTTDKLDYQPAETAYITGSQFQTGETVQFQVLHNDGTPNTGNGHDPWLVTDGGPNDLDGLADGNVETTWYVDPDDSANSSFELTAVGLSSGALATTTFTDSAGDYDLNYRAADPNTYDRLLPSQIAAPTGRASNPLNNAQHVDGVPSLAPSQLALGQIVVFEVEIEVGGDVNGTGDGLPSNDSITFTTGWDTTTTSNGAFGYDFTTFGVYAAFVDPADGSAAGGDTDATVNNISTTLVGDEMQGAITVDGLDAGETVVVEIWVVLQDSIPVGTTGNVQSRMVGAVTSGTVESGENIQLGNQTVPLNKVREFFTADADLSVTKSDPGTGAMLGEQFDYTIVVTNNSTDTVANDVVLTDTLDVNTKFISASVVDTEGSGSTVSHDGSPAGGIITGDLGFMNPQEVITITVTVEVLPTAPTSGTLEDGPCDGTEDLCNEVSVSALTDDPDTSNNMDDEPTNVIPINASINIEKATNGADADSPTGPLIPVGNTANFTYVVTNTGNVPLANVSVTDDQGVTVTFQNGDTNNDNLLDVTETWTYTAGTTVAAGQYTNIGTVTADDPLQQEVTDSDPSNHFGVIAGIDIEKATNGDDADTATGPLIPIGDTANFTYVVTNTGNVPLAFVSVTDDQGVTVTFQSGDTNNNNLLDVTETWTYTGSTTVTAGQYTNVGTVTAFNSPQEEEVDDSDPSNHFGVLAGINIEKATNGDDADTATGPLIAVGDTANFTYVVTNTGNVPLANVNVTDDQEVTVTFQSGDGNNNSLLDLNETWNYTASTTVTAGQYTNIGTVTADDPLQQEVTDSDPSNHFGVLAGINIEKATNGDDADTATGPLIAVGDTANFTYVVTNTGNVPLANVNVTDDQGVTVTFQSGDGNNNGLLDLTETWFYTASTIATAGQYTNIGTVTADDPLQQPVNDSDPSNHFGVRGGINIEKATNGADADNPTGPLIEVGDTANFTYVVTNTGNVPLANVNVTDDQGVTVTFDSGDTNNNGLLDLTETWLYTASTVATAGQYTNIGTVTADDQLQQLVTDSDPSNHFGVRGGINIEKATNGADADNPTGPLIEVGDTANFTYVVTNTGNVPLANVNVTDDQGVTVTFDSGDTNNNGLLDLTETWLYTASTVATAGQYTNIGTVTADDQLQQLVTDSDPSNHFGVRGGINIEKTTNGADADTPTGPLVPVGSTVDFTYVVTNTGNVPLANVNVTDDQGVTVTFDSGDTNNNGLLDLTETWFYTASTIATAGQYTNIGTVTADDQLQQLVSDSDPSNHFGVLGGINIEKTTNGADADTPTGPLVPVGSTVDFTYVVTNTGNVPLANVNVTDDQGVTVTFDSGDTNNNGLLDLTETWFYTASTIATAGQYTNIGTVTADDQLQQLVSDSDPSNHFGVLGGINIEKTTNGADADTPTGPLVPVGSTVDFTYVVTNTGNVPLANVNVTDDQGVTVTFDSGDTNNNGLLDLTETWFYTASTIATAGQYTNIGTVTADDQLQQLVSDSDPSNHFGVLGGINIEKTTNGADADTPTGPLVPVGSTVDFTYVVTNTGNVPLANVNVTDDQGVTVTFDSGDTNNNGLLDLTETWFYTASTIATAGQYTNIGTVTADDQLQQLVSDSDPSNHFGVLGGINIEKTTNGADADTPTGPLVPVGSTVDFTYVVTNTGNVPLANVNVTDDQGVTVTFDSGDTNNNGLLDLTETWFYTASTIATAGQYTNIGTVTADDQLQQLVSDSDPSNHFGVLGGINIEKTTNGADADTPTGPLVPVGSTVDFTYVVTNTGNVPLANVNVTDDQGVTVTFDSGDTNNNGLLDLTETWFYTASTIATAGQYTNIGTVTADDQLQQLVSDSDPSNHFGVLGGINIEKTTNGADADTPTGPLVPVGSTVDFTYVVTNTGNVPLANVNVTDDQGVTVTFDSGDTNNNGLLDLTETWFYTASTIATAGQYTNIGTVTADDQLQQLVSDSDPSNHFGQVVTITITGSKFWDRNANGIWDAGGEDGIVGNADDEIGLAGWTILAFADDGDGILDQSEFDAGPVAATVTATQAEADLDPNDLILREGDYSFVLDSDNYILVEVLQPGWLQSAPSGSSLLAPGLDTGALTLAPRGYAIQTGAGQDITDADFGNFLIGKHLTLASNLAPFNAPVNLANGDVWVKVEAGAATAMIARTVYDPAIGPVQIDLFDGDLNFLATSERTGGDDRLAWTSSPAEDQYLRIFGANPSVQLSVLPTVHQDGDTVTVLGTAGDDTFEFGTDLNFHTLIVAGTEHQFAASSVSKFVIDGGPNRDTLLLSGSPGDDIAQLNPTRGRWTGPNVEVRFDGISSSIVESGGGNDVAYLYDSQADDVLVGKADFTSLRDRARSFNNKVVGFAKVTSYAFRGGYDRAYLYDSVNDDRLVARPDWTRLQGDGFFNLANTFEQTFAYATAGGDDIATFFDSPGDDRFVGRPTFALMDGSGFYNYAHSFDHVRAYANAGGTNDRAFLYDSTGDDTLVAKPEFAWMRGPGFYNYVNQFDSVRAFANAGGVDNAYLHDSPNDDRLIAKPDYALLDGNGFYNYAGQFDRVYAYANGGGADRAYFYGSAGNDVFVGRSNTAQMRSGNYFNKAESFDKVYAYTGTGSGLDVARIYDSAGNDLFVGRSSWGRMTGANRDHYLSNFDRIQAYRTSGNDTLDLDAVDYIFDEIGGWL